MRRRDFLAAALTGTVAAVLAPRRALADSQRWVSAMDQTPRAHRIRGHRADMLIIDDPPGTDQPGHSTCTIDGGGVYDSRLGRFRCVVVPLLPCGSG